MYVCTSPRKLSDTVRNSVRRYLPVASCKQDHRTALRVRQWASRQLKASLRGRSAHIAQIQSSPMMAQVSVCRQCWLKSSSAERCLCAKSIASRRCCRLGIRRLNVIINRDLATQVRLMFSRGIAHPSVSAQPSQRAEREQGYA